MCVGRLIFTYEKVQKGFGNFLETFQPQMLCGSTSNLNFPNMVLIPESMAIRFYGQIDVIGKSVTTENTTYTIGGVYKDFPKNSEFENNIFTQLPQKENQNKWGNWNYYCYLRLDHPNNVKEIEELSTQKLQKVDNNIKNLFDKTNPIRLTPLTETHFSVINKNNANRSTIYLLLSISLLIVIIASINFMNFSLAEAPMRIKSINTQKILGATADSLRQYLIIESVLISTISYIFALIILFIVKDTEIQELVTADLNLFHHPFLLLVTFILSLFMGALAGIYPSYYVTSFTPVLVIKGSLGLSPKGKTLRSSLICLQFFTSFVLIIAVAIMYSQGHYIYSSEYGYNKDNIIVGCMSKEAAAQTASVKNELNNISGVKGVSISYFALNSSDRYMNWERGTNEQRIQFDCLPVDYDFLQLMEIPIIEGRNFRPDDGDVYIFNEAARNKYPIIKINEKAGRYRYL